jgi:hypothetical protein
MAAIRFQLSFPVTASSERTVHSQATLAEFNSKDSFSATKVNDDEMQNGNAPLNNELPRPMKLIPQDW